jgi:gliding motility-associated-like protein
MSPKPTQIVKVLLLFFVVTMATVSRSFAAAPTVQATSLTFSASGSTNTTANWTNGNGTSRAVFIKAAATGSPAPVDATTYTANTVFGLGTQIGATGWYCVYNGTGTSVTITGLSSNTNYQVMTAEYNGAAGSEQYLTTTGTGNPTNFTLVVPITTGSVTGGITACLGSASASPAIQQFNVSGFTLTNNLVATAPTGFEVSLSSTSGYGTSVTLTPSGGSVPSTTIYVRSSVTAAAGNISGNVTLSSVGNTSQTVAVSGLINALPTITAITNQTVVNGASTTTVSFSGTGNTFTWTNNTPGIGLAASGTGDMQSFTAVNNGTTPVTATITVTPQSVGLAYFTNSSSSNVVFVNTATHTQTGQVFVGFLPFGISVSPDGTKAYVSNSGGSSVSVINTSTNTVPTSITVGSGPRGIVYSPDGTKVYVANYGSSTISVINTATNTVSATFSVGNNPTGICISPDGTKLYTANTIDNTVSVVNTATNTVTATIPTGSSTRCIAISPDGTRVYVTNTNANTVSVINASTNTVIATITVGSSPLGVTVTPDGTKVYVANDGSNTVSVINTATNTVPTTINIAAGSNPYGISVKPDGTEVYVANISSSTATVINTATNTVSATVALTVQPTTIGNFITAGTGCAGTPITFTITVNPPVPTINTTGTLPAFTATYGGSSNLSSLNVSGTSMLAGILVTPPAGFEVSLNNSTFTPTVTVGAAGTIASASVYIRLIASNAAGTYSGNVVLASTSAVTVNSPVSGTVSKAALSITATNATKAYGVALTGAAGSTAFTSTGLKNSETIGSVTMAYGTGSAANAAVGAYTGSVTPSAATGGTFTATNYNITYNSGNITVTPVALTITATGPAKTYGTALPTVTSSTNFTVGATVSGETVSSVTLTPDAAGQSATTSAGATYTVTPSGATGTGGFLAGNYTITYAPFSSTVSKATLTYTATPASRVFGLANPTLTGTITGFVGIDTQASATTGTLSFTTTATTSSLPGTYAVTGTGLSATNYAFVQAAANSTAFTVLPSTNANLATLTASNGTLAPVFITATKNYADTVANSISSITFTPTLADATATITINSVTATSGSASSAIALSMGNNTVTVVVTAQDGVTKQTYTIIVNRAALVQTTVIANNFMSPNGDGKNDTWVVSNILSYPNNTVTVFDRAGRTVYTKKGYTNDWGGTFQGSPLNEDTYYYVIDLGTGQSAIKGFITLARGK